MKCRIEMFLAAGPCLWLSAFIVVLASGTPVAAKSQRSLPIIVYHQIRTSGEGPADGPNAISLQRFESEMAYLHAHGYRTLSMEEVIRFMNGERFPSKAVAIHFDDGWKSELSAVPVLNHFGFKASFWIIAGKGIGGFYMEWDEVETCSALVGDRRKRFPPSGSPRESYSATSMQTLISARLTGDHTKS